MNERMNKDLSSIKTEQREGWRFKEKRAAG
jgi:hypothetical protein